MFSVILLITLSELNIVQNGAEMTPDFPQKYPNRWNVDRQRHCETSHKTKWKQQQQLGKLYQYIFSKTKLTFIRVHHIYLHLFWLCFANKSKDMICAACWIYRYRQSRLDMADGHTPGIVCIFVPFSGHKLFFMHLILPCTVSFWASFAKNLMS